jgi:radical SAM protein with 4Fe4S-binding SPASM domain
MNLKRLKLEPHKLWQHLDEIQKWKKEDYFPPIYIEMSPTDRCQQRCHYCYTQYLGHQKLDITDDLYIRTMRDLGDAGVKSLQIQGTGEPLLHKKTPDAIIEANKSGVDVALCSNGVLFTPDKIDKCFESLSWYRISAVERNGELYSKSHGCNKEQFNQLIDNIKYMMDYRNDNGLDTIVGASIIAFPYNSPHIYETVKLYKDLGIDWIHVKCASISTHNPQFNWDRKTHIKFKDEFERIKEFNNDEFKVLVRYDQFMTLQDFFPKTYECCFGIEFETMIDADAKVYPCFHFWRNKDYCIGDLNENTFEEIWKSDRKKNVMSKVYQEHNLSECTSQCKNDHINKDLWELKNPPLHHNFP